MKRISNVVSRVLFALIIVVAFVLPASALTEKFKSSGEQVSVVFDSINGCIENFVGITSGEDISFGTFVLIGYTQSNNCTDPPTNLMSGFNFVEGLPKSAFQISPNLDSAELNTSIIVPDSVLNIDVPVTFSLTWTGTGNLGPMISHLFFHMPGVTATYTGSEEFAPPRLREM